METKDLKEEFIKEFPNMECDTEEHTAKAVANWWLSKLEAQKKEWMEELKQIMNRCKTENDNLNWNTTIAQEILSIINKQV